MPSDEHYMARAIALAEIAVGRTSPNPTVGCVLVRNGEVVGEGYHAGAGSPHAEVVAIRAAAEAAVGSTAYVTLEPCSTSGRTGPCTAALIKAGVSAVVYGTEDPNPAHRGFGLARLRRAGIAVRQAGDRRLLRSLNRGFFSWMERGRPFISAKVAVTLDGRVTLEPSRRTKLTSDAADSWVHRWRCSADAVAVGARTALIDDPLLTARPQGGCARQPTRVVFDPRGSLSVDSQLVRTAGSVPLTVVTAPYSPSSWRKALQAAGAEVLLADVRDGSLDLGDAVSLLGRAGMLEIAVEPGPRLLAGLTRAGLVDELNLLITPWVGDRSAPTWSRDLERRSLLGTPLDEADEVCGAMGLGWERVQVMPLCDDLLVVLRAVGAAGQPPEFPSKPHGPASEGD